MERPGYDSRAYLPIAAETGFVRSFISRLVRSTRRSNVRSQECDAARHRYAACHAARRRISRPEAGAIMSPAAQPAAAAATAIPVTVRMVFTRDMMTSTSRRSYAAVAVDRRVIRARLRLHRRVSAAFTPSPRQEIVVIAAGSRFAARSSASFHAAAGDCCGVEIGLALRTSIEAGTICGVSGNIRHRHQGGRVLKRNSRR